MIERAFFIIVFFCIGSVSAQINYEPGYYIDSLGNKQEVLIKNREWLDNPEQIDIKLNESSNSQTIGLDRVSEFGINEGSVYTRATVQLDLSSDKTGQLNFTLRPNYMEKTVFLKNILIGKASLYTYSGMGVNKFFFRMDDGKMEDLVYKRYLSKGKIYSNEGYKQTLMNALQCNAFSETTFEKLRYKREALTDVFLAYNECQNEQVVTYTENSKITDNESRFKFRATFGARFQSLSLSFNEESFDLDKKVGVQVGFEGEYIFAFNRNKWSLIGGLTYFGYSDTATRALSQGGTQIIELDYSAFDLSAGGRHSLFLNSDTRIMLSAGFILPLNLSQEFSITGLGNSDDFSNLSTYFLASGIEYKRVSAEIQYQGRRTLFSGVPNEYKTLSLTVGYNF